MNFFNKQKNLENLVFPKEINISDINYSIEIIFSKKKSSSVCVKDKVIIFRMSTFLSQKEAYEHFNYLLKKIHKKLENQNFISPILSFKDVFERGYFTFANELYKFEYSTKIRTIKLIDNIFYINLKFKSKDYHNSIEKNVIKLLINKYELRISQYVYQLNKDTYNFQNIGKISLKLLNSKWGHCTGKNDIMLNLKLLNASLEILNYVIIHELAHIKHKNHSVKYWEEVAKFCPQYKKIRKNLKLSNPNTYY